MGLFEDLRAAVHDPLEYSRLVAAAVEGGVFVSSEQTGTGASQNVAHGFGSIPSKVLVSVTDDNGGGYSVVEGSHDATNVKVTVTSGVKFKVLAYK